MPEDGKEAMHVMAKKEAEPYDERSMKQWRDAREGWVVKQIL